MLSKNSVSKRKTPRRRKVALACESCREKKVRCDGEKPICGPCARRSYSIDRCVYTIDNARSASNDAYIKILHDRIRELEEICTRNGASFPATLPRDADEEQAPGDLREAQLSTGGADTASRATVTVEGLLGLGSNATSSRQRNLSSVPGPSASARLQHPDQALLSSSRTDARVSEPDRGGPHGTINSCNSMQVPTEKCSSPPLDSHGNVTAMGAISAAEDGESDESPREQFYGNSSAASLMRLAGESMPIRSYMQALRRTGGGNPDTPNRKRGLWQDINLTPSSVSGFQIDDFSLPSRPLADHLLECYWDRVHCLYPFFHRPSFEQAYENLWGSAKLSKPELPKLNIGLGGSFDCMPQSITFHCALNSIFGLGCHFSDISAEEREAAVYTFFLRAKRFIGLDLLDTCTIGVVQTLLIIALFLQSTPYPNRCWNSIGVACRIAQGLGLHEPTTQRALRPLEREVRRRTWHGCVMMDMIVSMTYGRPSMTSHISPIYPVPLPAMRPESQSEDPCWLNGQHCDHQQGYMVFYVSTIELYKILESILADVYNAWQSRSNQHRTVRLRGIRQSSLDVIMELDDKLSAYEAGIPLILNWTDAEQSSSRENRHNAVFQRQRNVLRARFIHLRLLLYRPMFTQLCSEQRMGSGRHSSSDARSTSRPGRNVIYNSMSVSCAAACVLAAVELVSLVHDTYKTSVTDAWWYNGLYTSTAGFVLIMSYSCHSILDQVDVQTVDDTWRKCEEILAHMSSYSLSARNSLQFLQVTHQHIVQKYTASRRDDHSPLAPSQPQQRAHFDRSEIFPQPTETTSDDPGSGVGEPSGPLFNPLMSWDDIGLGQEDFGFLGRFDVPDLANWFSDVPDMSY
ncbi:uncharacterized protein N7459_002024 [Penicillium hispanicum]|uniref:uncharacterized protein n=1 Tax=Penicillium hispanicum TaxID=1080232 RepID=UPI002541F5DB|nr:uncharacterized protein N7459_002024 [Penicillium hispanicum]KAJ5591655.1 hypothetical protein N7459_002024 [Penicillium hispanicum]